MQVTGTMTFLRPLIILGGVGFTRTFKPLLIEVIGVVMVFGTVGALQAAESAAIKNFKDEFVTNRDLKEVYS